MDYKAANRLSVLPDAYTPPQEVDQGTNLAPSLQPDPCTTHELAAAEPGNLICLFPKCGAAFLHVPDLERHMSTHSFATPIHNNPNPSPFTPSNGYTGHAFPNTDTSTLAHPVGPSSAITGPPSTTVVPAVQTLVAVTGTATPARHHCTHPTCTSTFKRAADLHRHAKIHQPGARKYECFVPGCLYRGARGFLRRDKLLSHQRNAHGPRY